MSTLLKVDFVGKVLKDGQVVPQWGNLEMCYMCCFPTQRFMTYISVQEKFTVLQGRTHCNLSQWFQGHWGTESSQTWVLYTLQGTS